MKTGKNHLTVVGSVALDTVRTPFGSVKKALGGSAVYFSAAARHFAPVEMVGVAGMDFPSEHLRLLKKMGVGTSGLEIVPGKTFHWQGHYTQNLNEAITEKTELNVFAGFKPKLGPSHRQSKYLFLANIDPNLQLGVCRQISRPKWVACDTMNFWIESAKPALKRVLQNVDISLMNDAEIKMFTGELNISKAVKALMKMGPKVVIVKRGEYGAWCFTGSKYYALPAVLLDDVKDPTGAGDSFAGGFLGYLASTGRTSAQAVKDAAVYGTIVASFNVQSFSVGKLASLKSADIRKRRSKFLLSVI